MIELWQKDMKKLLMYSKEDIPYFKNVLKEVDFDDSIEDIYKMLPYQSKAIMRDSNEFINSNITKSNTELVEKITGGTTGEPWFITKTLSETTRYFFMLWKSRKQFGIVPSDHFYQFGGYGEINGVFTTKQVIEEKDFTELSMFHLNDHILDSYIEIINRGKGSWFFANPSALYLLALRMKDCGIKGLGRIKYIELTGERIYDYQEELISEVFDCPVSIMYGSREITTISHRCKYGCHHVLPNLYIETIDENMNVIDHDSDEMGEIVITSFIDQYMPFIKYKTGDFAVLKKKDDCQCGTNGLIFEKLLGRTGAFVEINGSKVHLEISYYLMAKFNKIYKNAVRQFEVTFKKPNLFCFRFVVNSPNIQESVYRFYEQELSLAIPGVKVEAEFVERIERYKQKTNPYKIED